MKTEKTATESYNNTRQRIDEDIEELKDLLASHNVHSFPRNWGHVGALLSTEEFIKEAVAFLKAAS